MSNEIFDIVNESDEIIGKASREEAHIKGLLHRSVLFFIIDFKGRVFVNQRSITKEFYPGHFSIVCGGHVESGEDYKDAAIREAKEEAGIDTKPIFLTDYKKRFNKEDPENIKVYAFITDKEPKLDLSEINHGRFMTIEELTQKLKQETFLPETLDLLGILKKAQKKLQKPAII